ncbi:MAG: hypothetical protein BAJALOKI1v1_810015 [Promethearchaeota archaeon]|nr:MAG: hypothetical protein BAJALOKI1v1_810015 [Candidatus Lokiarchaeota archaeon]
MSEFKNLIIIDITDVEEPLLDGNQNVKQIKGSGTIAVKNPSKTSRLWNSVLNLKEVVNTNAQKSMEMGIINPGKSFEKSYTIENLEKPCLELEEIFDTNRELSDKVNNAFLFKEPNLCRLTIKLTNTLDKPITDINITRTLPAFVKKIEFGANETGEVNINESSDNTVVNWTVDSISANETVLLELNFKAIVESVEEKELGPTNITYLVENHHLTLMDPLIRGLTDSLSGVTTDESASPGTWECNVEFINDSEFKVKLEKVDVTHNVPTGTEHIVTEEPELELAPDKSWDYDFQVESKNVPELESSIKFTTLYKVIKRVKGKLTKESTIYKVIKAKVKKNITPPEVNAYANTDMTIENVVTNEGSALINSLRISDTIPVDFIPPEIKDIELRLFTKTETIELHKRDEFINNLKINPDDISPDKAHTITIELTKLSDYFEPNLEFKMGYPILAKNPKPETKYATPVEIGVNPQIKGKEYINRPEVEPEIKIKYVARKLKTLKSIRPGASEGEFDISIRIQNKGKVELENIMVKDKIPSGFDVINLYPEELDYKVSQSELTIQIVELEGNESISIKFTCVGSGEYPRTEPNIIVMGRGAFKQGSGTPAEAESAPSVSTITPKMKAEIHEFFKNLYDKLEQGIQSAELGDYIEKMRDKLPPGPVLHSFMKYTRTLKEKGDEVIVGSLKDEIIEKLKSFEDKYV